MKSEDMFEDKLVASLNSLERLVESEVYMNPRRKMSNAFFQHDRLLLALYIYDKTAACKQSRAHSA